MDHAQRTRITILDGADSFSALGRLTLCHALIAALAADPTSIEALLRSTDAISFDASRRLLGALIEHDRWELLWRAGYAPPPGRDPERDVWPIVDPESFALARRPASAGLLWLDLKRRSIEHCLLPGGITLVGEVRVFDGREFLPRTVSYDLRGRWSVSELSEAPWSEAPR
jgi:hypothetical protein